MGASEKAAATYHPVPDADEDELAQAIFAEMHPTGSWHLAVPQLRNDARAAARAALRLLGGDRA